MTSDPARQQPDTTPRSESGCTDRDRSDPGTAPTHGLDQRAKALFADAIELPEGERAEHLRRACADPELRAEVEALLCAHQMCEKTSRNVRMESIAEEPGQVIGNYRLLQEIGSGGVGVVWMAEQLEPVRRKVALKILKLGMDTRQVVARFEAERQALALMEHPNIAKVFDGGATTRGRPYFVMELVRGEPITRYCDQAGLSIDERLRLFLLVCHAVQHAHTKGIIHRDLKPGNVLVTLHDGTPVPKVIDFGVAKATHRELTEKTLFTEFRQMLGTPEYMAPEQAELSGLDIDTRADIYSLGVLLYELLIGSRPFELGDALRSGCEELLRRIKEEDPPKPSTRASTLGQELAAAARLRRIHPKALSKLLRHDLDWVVMKALEKERGRRYETASAFAEDVQRFLEDRPVHAGPPSRLYRLTKYLRRHRVGATAVTAVLASLVVGLGAALVSYFDAREKERIAVTQATRAETVIDLFVRMIGSSDPHALKGPNYPLGKLLDEFDNGREMLKVEPEVQATLRRALGLAYLGLGVPRKAEAHLKATLEIRQRICAEDSVTVAQSILDWANYLHAEGDYRGAEANARRAMTTIERLPPDHEELLADALETLAENLRHLARYDEAWKAATRALDIRTRRTGEPQAADSLAVIRLESGDVVGAEKIAREALAIRQRQQGGRLGLASSLGNLAAILKERGDLESAETYEKEAYGMQCEILGSQHPSVAASLGHLADIRLSMGDLAGAEAHHREALAIRKAALGDDHPHVARSMTGLGGVLRRKGEALNAEKLHRDALAILLECPGGNHAEVANVLLNLATAVSANGDVRTADELSSRALAMQVRVLGEDHPDVAGTRHSIAQRLRAREDFAGAERELRQALDMYRRAGQQETPKSARSRRELGGVLMDQGNLQDAERNVRDALEVFGKLLGEENPDYAKTLGCLGDVLLARGDLGGAEAAHRRALAIREQRFGVDHAARADSLNGLACVLKMKGELDESAKLFRESLAIDRKLHPDGHPHQAAVLHNLATVLEARQELEEAEEHMRAALAMRQKWFPGDSRHLALVLHNLGHLLLTRGKEFAEAEDLLRQALRMHKASLGDSSPTVGTNFHTLGRALVATGKLDEAEKSLRRALAIRRERSGNASRDVANTLHWLGNVLLKKGDFAGAAERLEESLAVTRKILGDRDPSVTGLFFSLVSALRSKGDTAGLHRAFRVAPVGAVESLREKVATQSQTLGDDHPDVTGSILDLASILREQKDFDAAERVLRAAPAMTREVHGDLHAEVVHKLGHILGDDRGDARSAMSLYRRSLQIRRPGEGPGDAIAADYLKCLARAADRAGELEVAEASYRDAVSVLKRLAPGSTDLATRQAEFGLLLLRRENAKEAETVLRESLAIRKDQSPDHWTFPNTKSMLGEALLGQGRFAEAEPLLLEGHEEMAESLRRLSTQSRPSEPRDVEARVQRLGKARDRLVSLYAKWGQPEKAAHWKAKPAAAEAAKER